MSWVDEYLARQQGQQQAQQAGAANSSFLGGFISSGVSAVGEMFGMDPFPSAQTFRDEHPYAGVASELLGGVVPYVGWEGAIAKVPALAEGLDGLVNATKIDKLANPIKYGAANLAIRYAPVELARLGTGLVTTDDWNKYQGLMADVGLSTLLTGGIGALGGFIHSGGSVERTLSGRLAEAPIGWAAPFQLRLADSPTAEVIGNAPIEQVKQDLLRETFLERPLQGKAGSAPVRAPAVGSLEGVEEPKAAVQLSTMFNESKAAKPQGLIRQKLMKTDGTWTLGDDGNNELLGALGLQDMGQLAQSGRFPTIVDVGSDSAAGTMRRAVEGLSPVADGVLMGREAGDGLFIVGKRIRAGIDPSAKVLPSLDAPQFTVPTPREIEIGNTIDQLDEVIKVGGPGADRAAAMQDQLLAEERKLKDARQLNDTKAETPREAVIRRQVDTNNAYNDFIMKGPAEPAPGTPEHASWKEQHDALLNAKQGALDAGTDLPKTMSQQTNINPGDRWFFVKTDQPQRFAPQTSKSADLTFNQFAKFREPYDPARAVPDYFNGKQNLMLQAMTPADYRDVLAGRMNKDTFRAKVGQTLAKQAGDFQNLAGSELLNRG
jgi:hypothetical protein